MLRFLEIHFKFTGLYRVAENVGTSVDQVKGLLALRYGRLEAIRHSAHCKGPFKKVKGRKVIPPEIFKSDIL